MAAKRPAHVACHDAWQYHNLPRSPAVGSASLYPCYITAMPSIRDNTALSRFELEADGVSVFMNYRITGDVISLDHTETPVAARGRGLASRLIQGVLDECVPAG